MAPFTKPKTQPPKTRKPNVRDKKGRIKAHRRTVKIAARVEKLVGYGITEQRIADAVDIAVKTMRKYYAIELQVGRVAAIERVADALFENALAGDVKAQTFYLKTVGGWNETINIVNPDAVRILTNEPMTDAEFNEKFCNGIDPILIKPEGTMIN